MFFYTGMLIWFIVGNIISDSIVYSKDAPKISIIIAIRNGEKTLPSLLEDLSLQDYSGELEFILVNDGSIDDTMKLIQEKAVIDERFIYETSVHGDSFLHHKKRALDAGIKKATNEWLLFTDVDCRLKSSWARGMAKYFTNEVDYVIGFSEVEKGKRLVTNYQSMDYFMLMIAARGVTKSGHAWACSGQNQAYRKSLFDKVGGYSKIANKLQGDDSLFLQVCRNQSSVKVIFADNNECITIARQENAWRELIKQRIRWAGDAKIMWEFNGFFFIFILSSFLLPLLLMITFFSSIIYDFDYITIFVKFLTFHFMLEFILYFVGVHQFSKSIHYFNFIIWFIINIPYNVLMGLGSFFSNQLSWRGR